MKIAERFVESQAQDMSPVHERSHKTQRWQAIEAIAQVELETKAAKAHHAAQGSRPSWRPAGQLGVKDEQPPILNMSAQQVEGLMGTSGAGSPRASPRAGSPRAGYSPRGFRPSYARSPPRVRNASGAASLRTGSSVTSMSPRSSSHTQGARTTDQIMQLQHMMGSIQMQLHAILEEMRKLEQSNQWLIARLERLRTGHDRDTERGQAEIQEELCANNERVQELRAQAASLLSQMSTQSASAVLDNDSSDDKDSEWAMAVARSRSEAVERERQRIASSPAAGSQSLASPAANFRNGAHPEESESRGFRSSSAAAQVQMWLDADADADATQQSATTPHQAQLPQSDSSESTQMMADAAITAAIEAASLKVTQAVEAKHVELLQTRHTEEAAAALATERERASKRAEEAALVGQTTALTATPDSFQPAPVAAAAADAAALPPGWAPAVSSSTGDTYYVNETTGETTYDRPGTAAGEAVAAAKEGLPPGWEPVVSRSTGETYFHNMTTDETTYDRPTAAAAVSSEDALSAALVLAEAKAAQATQAAEDAQATERQRAEAEVAKKTQLIEEKVAAMEAAHAAQLEALQAEVTAQVESERAAAEKAISLVTSEAASAGRLRSEAAAAEERKHLEGKLAVMEAAHVRQLESLQAEAAAKAAIEIAQAEAEAAAQAAKLEAELSAKAEAEAVANKKVQEAQLKELWELYDADDSGTLDTDELKRVLVGMGSDADVDTVMSVIDKDGDGQADPDEFLVWWKQQDAEAHHAVAEASKARKAAAEAEALEKARLMEEKVAAMEAAQAAQLEAAAAAAAAATEAELKAKAAAAEARNTAHAKAEAAGVETQMAGAQTAIVAQNDAALQAMEAKYLPLGDIDDLISGVTETIADEELADATARGRFPTEVALAEIDELISGVTESVSLAVTRTASSPATYVESAHVMEITVPEGSTGGDTISLDLPDGRDADIEIPVGLKAGDVFEVELDDDGDEGSETVPLYAPGNSEPAELVALPPAPAESQPPAEAPSTTGGGVEQQVIVSETEEEVEVEVGDKVYLVGLPSNMVFQIVPPEDTEVGTWDAGRKLIVFGFGAPAAAPGPEPAPAPAPEPAPEPEPEVKKDLVFAELESLMNDMPGSGDGFDDSSGVEDSGDDEHASSMDVTVPEGVKAGDTISLELPDGREMEVKIPPGHVPGDVFEIELDEEEDGNDAAAVADAADAAPAREQSKSPVEALDVAVTAGTGVAPLGAAEAAPQPAKTTSDDTDDEFSDSEWDDARAGDAVGKSRDNFQRRRDAQIADANANSEDEEEEEPHALGKFAKTMARQRSKHALEVNGAGQEGAAEEGPAAAEAPASPHALQDYRLSVHKQRKQIEADAEFLDAEIIMSNVEGKRDELAASRARMTSDNTEALTKEREARKQLVEPELDSPQPSAPRLRGAEKQRAQAEGNSSAASAPPPAPAAPPPIVAGRLKATSDYNVFGSDSEDDVAMLARAKKSATERRQAAAVKAEQESDEVALALEFGQPRELSSEASAGHYEAAATAAKVEAAQDEIELDEEAAQDALLQQVWDNADADGSGDLDADEILQVLIGMGHNAEDIDLPYSMAQILRGEPGTTVGREAFKRWFFQLDQEDQNRVFMVHYYTADGTEKMTDMRSLMGLLADGSVTPETMVWLDGLSDWMPLQEAQQLSSDQDGGQVVAEALRKCISDAPIEQQAGLIKRVWAHADADGNGTLDRQELELVLLQMGKAKAELDVDAVLAEIDANGDGLVDFLEFEKFWVSQAAATRDEALSIFYATATGEQVETTLGEVREMLKAGTLGKQTSVWMDGWADWKPVGSSV